jgi:tetratricopeptide (TPR) repeat protein
VQRGSIASLVGPYAATFVLLFASGCVRDAAPIPRVLDGTQTLSPFVSPHQYEWFVRGELALAAGDLDAAAVAFEQARLGPADDVLVVIRLAETERRRGRLDRARELVRVAASLEPTSEAIALERGAIAEQEADLDAALLAYDDAIARAPRSDQGPLARARVLVGLGRGDEAVAVLEALSERAPGSLAADRAAFELALARADAALIDRTTRALLTRSPGARARVVEAARALLETRPDLCVVLLAPIGDEDVARLRLTALARARRPDELVHALLETPLPPADAAALHLLAGDPTRALEALEGSPDAEDVRCLRKRALTALGRTPEAARVVTREECSEEGE